MTFVLDGSVTMAWCFRDETTAYTNLVLHRLQTTEAMVPVIWPLEVVNVALVGERRGRIVVADTLRFVLFLRSLPIEIDDIELPRVWGNVLDLARAQQLTLYDASYLELALREGLPLATLDDRLREAANRIGVPLVS